jgi:ABC-type polysaccharide/polyol phosphate export permease
VALFVQQPVSGVGYPPSFAPDAVRWAEPVAPLRYLVEGVRNVLVGGSTTFDMALALVALAAVGILAYVAGMYRLDRLPVRRPMGTPTGTARTA